ncbi:MAG: GNAT family N-acetyltransferase [Bryobacterales bacterium]|nr:GNAT family N-acetyltransferase [Bryobacterales bacterium]
MSDNVDLSIRQFCDAWRILCGAASGYGTHSAEGVECVFSGVPIPFFNAVILTGRSLSPEGARAAAESAGAWAAGRGVPWILVATHEAMEPGSDCAAVLESCGFVPVMALTGMMAERVAPVDNVPDGLELRIPEDDAACEAILDVNSAAYDMPFAVGQPVWGRRAFWKDHYPVIGFAGEQPVSSSVVIMSGGYRYVALVATAPDQQRRGYASAAMRRALELAREAHGEHPTFLHATGAGRPVYERMGYRAVSSHTAFMDKRFLGEH